MALSKNLIDQFAKISTPEKKDDVETLKGTCVILQGVTYVRIDGSEVLTPVNTAVQVTDKDRVHVEIKDHEATIIRNMTNPSAGSTDLTDLKKTVDSQGNTIIQQGNSITQQGNSITQMGNTITQQGNTITQYGITIKQHGDKITSIDNTVTSQGNVITAQGNTIVSQGNAIDSMNNTITQHGDNIKSMNNTITQQGNTIIQQGNDITSQGNDIKAQGNSITILNSAFVIEDGVLKGLNGIVIDDLEANHLDTKYADIDFANITSAAVEKLFSDSGIIKDLIVSEGHITGELVGVTIKGDLIEAGTVKADKLVVKGQNGLYYKLNLDSETIEAQQTNENSLNGSVITAKSITATKIQVDDLVAFGATIGGFEITDSAIHSVGKNDINNDSNGLYMDKTGQLYVGDNKSHIKYYNNGEPIHNPVLEPGSIDSNTGEPKDDLTYVRSKDFIEIKSGTNYKISGVKPSCKIKIWFYDSNQTIIDGWFKDETKTYNYKYMVNNEIIKSPSIAKFIKTRARADELIHDDSITIENTDGDGYVLDITASAIKMSTGTTVEETITQNTKKTDDVYNAYNNGELNGKPSYTWIKYADTPTSGMSDSPDEKAYMGIASNKDTDVESDKYEDYKWSLIQGSGGGDGVIIGTEAPSDTTRLWLNTSDNKFYRYQEDKWIIVNDVSEDLIALQKKVNNVDTQINDAINEYNNTVKSTIYTKKEVDNAISSTKDGINLEFTNKITTIESTAYNTATTVQDLSGYINTGTKEGTTFLELGNKSSDYKVRIENDSVAIIYKGNPITQWEQDLFQVEAIISKILKLGNKLAFVVNNDGSVSFRKVT